MTFLIILALFIGMLVLNARVADLRARVKHIEHHLHEQSASVRPHGSVPHVPHEAAPAPPAAHEAPAEPQRAPVLTLEQLSRPTTVARESYITKAGAEHRVVASASSTASEPATPAHAPVERQGMTEFKLSGNVLVWVGAIAVLLGVGFFLKYSFEHNIIGPTGRVVLGILAAFVCLGIGEYLHAKYTQYAHLLSGTGIALLYLSFYGTLYYQIGSPLTTLFFMALVTATSLMLSVRYNSRGIAVLGLIGGYGTPLFFGGIAEGLGGFVLLNYLAILNVGILTLAYFKNWSWAVWSGFVGTALLVSGWLLSPLYDVTKFNVAFLYVTLFWLLFTFAVLIFYYFHERTPTRTDAILLLLVGVHYAGTMYALLLDLFGEHKHFFGLLPLMLACVYAGIAYLGITVRTTERALALYPLGAAVLFLTLVFPFEFEGKWLTVAWFSEAAVLGFLAVFIRSVSLARFAAPVYLLGVWFLLVDMPRVTAETMPILNERFFLFLVAIASAFCLMYAFGKIRAHFVDVFGAEAVERGPVGGESYARVMFIAANVLVGFLVFSEIGIFSDYIAVSSHAFHALLNSRFLLLLLVVLYAYGVLYQSSIAKRDGRVAIAFIAANVLMYLGLFLELVDYTRFADAYHPILNMRTLILLVGVGYAGVVSYYAKRGVPKVCPASSSVAAVMFTVLNLQLVLWGILEIGDYYRHLSTYVAFFNVRTLVLFLGVAYAGIAAYLFRAKSVHGAHGMSAPFMFAVVNVLLLVWGLMEIADYYQYLEVYAAFFNPRTFVFLVGALGAGVVSYVLYHHSAGSTQGTTVGLGYLIAANVLVVLLGLIEILDYHHRTLLLGVTDRVVRNTILQQASMYITGYLVLYGFAALVFGLLRRFTHLRNIAITVLTIAIAKVFLNDIWALDTIYRIVALLSLGITLLVVGYLYVRYKDRITPPAA